jgi:hypothetical protein
MVGEGERREQKPIAKDQTGSRALVVRPGSEVAPQVPSRDEQEEPLEQLVANFRRLIEQARERHSQGRPDGSFHANEPFEPAEWLG